MAFGLTIGTERAVALQNAIQDELTKRGYSDADPVMAEYITIMIINNKTAEQISSELEDLIGSDFDPNFVEWLFAEVAKSVPESEVTPAPERPATIATPVRESPPHLQNDAARRPPTAPRAPLYQQAISQVTQATSPSDRKRTRSTSPGHAAKLRRLDVPTGPRAMLREGNLSGSGGARSLLDRVGPRNGHAPYMKDDIQARIDNITNAPTPEMAMMMSAGGFPMNGMPGIDMNAMAGMANPLMLQEMMMNQMALINQMAGAMGIMNPAAAGFMNAGFPMQSGMGGDMGPFNNNMNQGQQMGGMDGASGRGRGRGRAGPPSRGSGRGRGGQPSANFSGSHIAEASALNGPASSLPAPSEPISAPTVVAPTPKTALAAVPVTPISSVPPATFPPAPSRTGFVPPERPQSPTLCKFGLKCTNPLCRWSHPSPVATPESGVVLSNEACEAGKNCKDKDCIKAHVSPAVLNPTAVAEHHKPAHYTPPPSHPTQTQTPCRYGAACTRPGCPYLHPSRPNTQACRFGAACTRANCPFQHPEGRVLPSTFHRGLTTAGPIVSVPTPEAGSIGVPSPHKSVTFNRNLSSGITTAAELEKRVREMEEKKSQAEAAVAQAQAAASAAGKKDSTAVAA